MAMERRLREALDQLTLACKQAGDRYNLTEDELMQVYAQLADRLIEEGESYAARQLQKHATD